MNLEAQEKSLPTGTNIRLFLQDCRCDSSLFHDVEIVRWKMKLILKECKLTFLHETHHQFEDGGYTLAIILSESHIVIHTWDEHSRLVLVELSICNFTQDNKSKARNLADEICAFFQSQKTVREETGMIPRLSKSITTGHGFYVDINDVLETVQSSYQQISIADTESFGKTLILDDVFQTTEKDHAFYHEPLVHVPMMHHPEPKKILICGGGDGGAAYEILKHPIVKSCDIVEIDQEVIRLSKQYLSEVHRGIFSDHRIQIHISNAHDFLQQCNEEYDVILIDATHSVNDENSMFTQSFYQLVQSKLKSMGIVGLHAGLPYTQQNGFVSVVENVQSTFSNANPYLSFVPSFGTVSCFFLCLPENTFHMNRDLLSGALRLRALHHLQLLSPDTVESWFTIPPNLQSIFRKR